MVSIHQLYVAQIRCQLVQNTVVYYHDVPILNMKCIPASFVKHDSFLNRQDMYEAYLKKKGEREGGNLRLD